MGALVEPRRYQYSAEEESQAALQEDAGAIAAQLMRRRSDKVDRVKRFIRNCIIAGLMLLVLLVAAVAYYGYATRTKSYTTVNRTCSVTLGSSELSGTRSYSYPFVEYFGFRLTDTKEVDEKSYLTLTGSAIQVIGVGGKDGNWVLNMKDGERGNQPLKPAEMYIFQQGKNTAFAKYGEFCK